MWEKPWNFKEGFILCLGLIITGVILQLSVGFIEWKLFSWPANVITLIGFILTAIIIYLFRKKIYVFRFLTTYQCVVPALIAVVILTIIMGITKQVPNGYNATDKLGITHILSFWPFVLIYCWITIILSQALIHQLVHFDLGRVPSIFFHAGLFSVLLTATLGHADVQKFRMTIQKERPEWKATDENGNIQDLDIAIQLNSFTIEEYPPKLFILENSTGKALPLGMPEMLSVDSTFKEGTLLGWDVELIEYVDMAKPIIRGDSISYQQQETTGAVSAMYIRAISPDQKQIITGWVSTGSYLYPYQLMKLDNQRSIAMPEREPQRYLSQIEIYTKSGEHIKTEIQVNKPYSLKGWKIYQLNYNTQRGRWSEISILELVHDPWSPVVYTGIIWMLLGAVLMLVTTQKERGEKL